jgi:multidrug resistance protein MdtO
MSSLAQSVPESPRPLVWFWEFLKEELAPRPGRTALVARMVIAATIVMLITMTFRLPYGAYAAIYAITISRESPQTTVKTVKTIIAAFVLGAGYVLIGSLFFLNDPVLRLLWVIGTLFVSFYAISAVANYGAATRFGYLIMITVSLWDRHIPVVLKVEGTLWAVWAIVIASIVTVFVELVFAEISPGDDLLRSIADRLTSVTDVLASYLADTPLDPVSVSRVTRFAMLGTSRLRRDLRRSTVSREYSEQMGALVALVGRLVDIAANLTSLSVPFAGQTADRDRQRIQGLIASISGIRSDLLRGSTPGPIEFTFDGEASGSVPLLREMEKTVSLIPEALSGSGSIKEYATTTPGVEKQSSLLVADAFSNSEHLKFGLKGCLAASLCYIIYNAIDWPGINTAVITCLLTALSTVGSSRQKQVLRFTGAIAGGVVVGMGAQIYILPHLDSIAGFTLLFVAVTGAAAWLATSGPRFSYFGIQFAVAFYLINLQEFKIQTSLAVARDRIAGILLGLFMMWLVFDQLWGTPAAVEMKRTFVSNLRLLAQFVHGPLGGERGRAIERSASLRDTIDANFDKVWALADGVVFEFGSSRLPDLALRSEIRELQPELRTFYLTRIALLKYRLQLPGFELPEAVCMAQQEFDDRLGKILDVVADHMEGKAQAAEDHFEDAFERLEQKVVTCCGEKAQQLELQTFLALSRNLGNLATKISWLILE